MSRGRARQVTTISANLIRFEPDGSAVANMWPDLPPIVWIVQGRRGGHYLATGERTRVVMQTGDDWMRNTWSVIDTSAGCRYIRPSRAARLEADS